MNTPKMNGKSINPQEELLQQLKEQFPEVFSEGKIDPDKLKQTLGEQVSSGTERYGLNWAGKSNVFREIQKTTSATLAPLPQESVNFDTTKNLFIEGDNLEVLRILQRSYYGKIKMIYIDPPYNTGNDFIYNDNFKQDKTTYEAESGQRNDNGDLLKDTALRRNTRDNGHYHSDWLNMMYPRLFLARNLLRQDGLVFISMDDHEVHNLRIIMDEIFGEENFITQFVWNTDGHTDNQLDVKINHEYIILYAKNSNRAKLEQVVDPNTRKDSNLWKGYAENSITKNGPANPPSEIELPIGFPCSIDEISLESSDLPEGYFSDVKKLGYISRQITEKWSASYPVRIGKLTVKNSKLLAPCKLFSGWANVNKLKQFIENNCNPIMDNGDRLSFFLSEKGVLYYRREREKARNILSVLRNFGTTEKMRSELEKNGIIFDYPKPKDLISYLISIGSGKNDLVMDFFAGSATTAHALIELNEKDGQDRNFIMVQLPEKIDENSEAFRLGYRTISEISIERIRKIASQVGVKFFRLKASNFEVWNQSVVNPMQLTQQLKLSVENTSPDANQSNLLYELILKSGLELTEPVKRSEQAGVTYFVVGNNKLVVCLKGTVTRDFIDFLERGKPAKVIFLERVFANNDDLKTNTILNLERADIDFKVV